MEEVQLDQELPCSTIMIDLDTLFDTRLSVLLKMGDEAVSEAFKDDMYYHRTSDRWPNIDPEEFKRHYDTRTKELLKTTSVTPILSLVTEFASKTIKNISNTPFHSRPKCVVNTYPYKLIEPEVDVLLKTLAAATKGLCDIEIVHMTLDDITPRFVKNNLAIMVMYEYYKWLELHSANGLFKKTTCPEVALFGPMLYFIPRDNTIEGDAFKAMEEVMGPLIGLRLFPIEMFSTCIRLDKLRP
jgi:hypothetical protein